jgi:nucleotide-binding universal stress UspA family protein
MKEVYQGMKSEAETMLDKKKSQAINDSHIVVKTHVTYGYPSDKIVQFAERHNMNLISIGSVGRTGISKIKIHVKK